MIGEHIRSCADRLVDEWERASRREGEAGGEARRASRAELRDHLPQFLRAYGEALAGGRNGSLWERAADHGELRQIQGWGPEAMTRDFLLLRRLLVSELRRGVDVTTGEMAEISADFDEAVAASVAAYVEKQEEQRSELTARLQRQNEELTATAEQLRRSHEDLKRFAHVVAHEVRNPLALVLAATWKIERDLSEKSELRHPLQAVSHAVVTIRGVSSTNCCATPTSTCRSPRRSRWT